ncbi:MAG: hypothetical protein A2Z51_03315 [Deltaproteobacteria bacterium RBG_19FT_COMBO_52_11]|nr:MAG: hypothetical protein A2Z51_03315 [Deltaproteobacteria bacterium RBG_19FT_COMBO_52_11]
MWNVDQLEFLGFSIRGKDYDAKFFGVRAIIPPTPEAPYWEIEFEDGSKMVTNDVISFRFTKKKMK